MRATLLSLAFAAGFVAACSGGDPGVSHPGPATAGAAVAGRPPLAALSVAHGSQPAPDDEEPIDVNALRLPQPDDTEPEPVN